MSGTADHKDELVELAMAAQQAALEVVDALLDGKDDFVVMAAASVLVERVADMNDVLKPIALRHLLGLER